MQRDENSTKENNIRVSEGEEKELGTDMAKMS
jgi:hypothetical protein